MQRPIIIIQARTGSTRLPNKMIMPFYNGKSVLQILIERLKASLLAKGNKIVVATTNNKNDDSIVELCNNLGITYYRGSEEDVLSRFIEAAKANGADKIIRVCADNVFLDINSLLIIADYLENNNCDYVSFRKTNGTPSILTHYGFFCEGVTLKSLEHVASHTSEPFFHEHVTNRIYTAPDIYHVKLFPIEDAIPGLEIHDNLRLTLDTNDDFDVQKTIYSYMNNNNIPLTPENILYYLDNYNPSLYLKMTKTIKENSKR